jgi:mRNA interferase RelE/StbE
MKLYTVVLSKTAEKELYKLPAKIIERIIPVLKSLETNPRPVSCKKLKGHADLWRIRVGDYRIVYAIDDVILLVDVRKIGHRKDIYED